MTKPWVGWRPSKMDEATVKLLEDIFKIDWTVSEACSYAWISRETYYNREKADKRFLDRMDKAKAYPFILARKTLMKGMQDGDNKSAIEYLKRRDNRYKDKTEIDQTTRTIEITEDNLYDQEDENT